VNYLIETFDWFLIYFSVGLFFGVTAVVPRRSSRDWNIAVLSVAFWPVFGTLQLLAHLKGSDNSNTSSNLRMDSIRMELARLLEAERPGISIVRAREIVDWYVDLATTVRDFRTSVSDRQIESMPELLKVSDKTPCSVSALSLEIRAMNKAVKHLRTARNSFIEDVLNNSLISPNEEARRVKLILELSELCGDHEETSVILNKKTASVEAFIPISGSAESARTTSF